MSKQSWKAGVCVLLTDSVCVEVSVHVSGGGGGGGGVMSVRSVLLVTCVCLAGAAGPRRLSETPFTVKQSTVELNRPLLEKKRETDEKAEIKSRVEFSRRDKRPSKGSGLYSNTTLWLLLLAQAAS